MIKKIVIPMAVVPVATAALIVAALVSALNWPTLVVNSTTLGIAARHLAPLGITLSWRNAGADMTSHGFLDETVHLAFDDLCIAVKPTLQRACFARFEIAGRYRFAGFVPELVDLGPVTMENGSIGIVLEDDKGPPSRPEGRIDIPAVRLPGFFKDIALHPLVVSLSSFDVQKGATVYAGALDIRSIENDGKITRIEIIGNVDERTTGRKLDVRAAAESATGFVDDDWQLRADIAADLGSNGTATADVEVARAPDRILSYHVDATFRRDAVNARGMLGGTLGPDMLETTLAGNLSGIAAAVPDIALPRCTIALHAADRARNRGTLTLSCPVDVRLKKFSLPPDLTGIYSPPERMHVDIDATANMFFMPDFDQTVDGTLTVRLAPSTSRLVDTRGNVTIAFAGTPSAPPERWQVNTDIDIDFVIREFKKVVAIMNATPWKVPAPFNVLDGSIELSLEGHLSSASQLGTFPIRLATRLRSEKQSIDLDGEGKLTFGFAGENRRRTSIEATVMLDNVQLQIPDIALAGIPRFTPDNRIILNPEPPKKKPKNKTPFDYRVHVATAEGRPARVLWNLTPTHIPITADLVIENGDLHGTVALTTFPIKFFNRTATLDSMTFDLKEPMETSTVDGSLSYEFPELKAMVVVQGPFAHPRISLESKPPMPPGDILATIVYGEPLDKIDSDQADSVGNMNAAMTSNALALTSFILLGSTPIQGVSYDPSTGAFSARVRLAKKTSLVVGAGGGTQQAMLRQRLGKGFSISAGADKSPDDTQTAGTAYIEWSKRF